MNIHPLMRRYSNNISHAYLRNSLRLLGFTLAKSSSTNPHIKQQLIDFREGSKILFKVNYLKQGYFVLQLRDQRLHLIKEPEQAITAYDLAIMVKHPKHAFKILTLQESNVLAVANNRFLTSGDASLAIRFINCLEIVEAHLLPNFISKNLLAKHEQIVLIEKIKFVKDLII